MLYDDRHMKLTLKEKRQALEVRRLKCAEGHEMRFLDNPESGGKRIAAYRPELYCESCHVSAPLW